MFTYSIILELVTTGFSPHEVLFGKHSKLFLLDMNDDYSCMLFLYKFFYIYFLASILCDKVLEIS